MDGEGTRIEGDMEKGGVKLQLSKIPESAPNPR